MAKVENREFLLIKKLLKLKEIHGDVKGTELFDEQYGQKGIDDVYNYMVSCATPRNYAKARAAGFQDGHVITPTIEYRG